jgi:hypothetical protein
MKPANVKRVDWYHYNALFFMVHILGYPRFQKYFGTHQKNFYKKIDAYLAGTESTTVYPLIELDNDISDEDFLKICYDGPRIFRGAAKDWDAVKKWDLEFFEQNYGDQKIIIMNNVGLTDNEYETMSFKHYIEGLRSGSLKYLKFSDLVHENEELKGDFNMKWLRKLCLLPFSWGEVTRFFMGGKGTLTPLHVGFSNFLFTQVMGKKKWIFYPPNNRMFLDARTERTTYLFSKANPYELNDPEFPLMKYATRYEAILEPGDIIWVPSFTWHYVENPTHSIALRYGRSSMLSVLRGSKMFTMLIFLATKPTLFEHFFVTLTRKRDSIYLQSQEDLNKKDLLHRINPFKRKK